jgi:hypothetical protein
MFDPGTPFQPCLIIVGEARSLTLSGAPERCFTWVGSGITRKYYNRLERLARDKHSSLLHKFANYGQKSFITLGSGPKIIKLITAVIYGFL